MDAAHERLKIFIKSNVDDYDRQRDLPDVDGTSRLSPYLHFGQLSPRQIWATFVQAKKMTGGDIDRYLSEIGWREFSYHLMYHFSYTPEAPLRSEFSHFPWKEDADFIKAWQKGQTGYPLSMLVCASSGQRGGCTIEYV